MDVHSIMAKRKRRERWRLLLPIVLLPVIVYWSRSAGDWTNRVFLAYSFWGGIEIARRRWLWRVIDRNSRKLEEVARPLGLAENSVDDRVYEGTRGTDYVRVSLEEPMILRHGGHSNVRVLDGILFMALFTAAAWLGWAWLVVAAIIAVPWTWYSTRSFVVVSTSREDGTSDRQTLRRVSDVPATLGSDKLTPVEVDPLPLEPEVDLPGLIRQIWTLDDDSELTSVLRLLGETGLPETLGPLLTALRKRERPMSPRAMAAAEQAVAKIRERHHLPDSGTLALSDPDEAGRLAVAHEAGALALPPRDRSGQ